MLLRSIHPLLLLLPPVLPGHWFDSSACLGRLERLKVKSANSSLCCLRTQTNQVFRLYLAKQLNQLNQFSLPLSAPACRAARGQQGAVKEFLWMAALPAEASGQVRVLIYASQRSHRGTFQQTWLLDPPQTKWNPNFTVAHLTSEADSSPPFLGDAFSPSCHQRDADPSHSQPRFSFLRQC